MAKMVGLSRTIKLAWLDKALELASLGVMCDEMKDELEQYLRFEIDSETNRRKTREILTNVWGRDNGRTEKLRNDGIALAKQDPTKRLAAHWAMLMATYPVFVDIARLFGIMGEYQDEITTSQLKKKIFDEWGERTTILHSSEKLVATLNNLGVIERVKPGRYAIAEPIELSVKQSAFLIYADMLVNESSYRRFSELRSTPDLFPFDCQITKEHLIADSRFDVGTFGNEFSVLIN